MTALVVYIYWEKVEESYKFYKIVNFCENK